MITRGDNIRELDCEVRVVLNQPGMPAVPSVGVKSASFGLDWDHGKLLLRTEKPIVSKPKTKRQRKDEWDKQREMLNEKVTKQLQVIASNMRLLAAMRKFSQDNPELGLELSIDEHMNRVREALKQP